MKWIPGIGRWLVALVDNAANEFSLVVAQCIVSVVALVEETQRLTSVVIVCGNKTLFALVSGRTCYFVLHLQNSMKLDGLHHYCSSPSLRSRGKHDQVVHMCHVESEEKSNNTVWSHYNAVNFFIQNYHKRHMIARPFKVIFCPISAVMYAISCYIGPCYNGTQLYLE